MFRTNIASLVQYIKFAHHAPFHSHRKSTVDVRFCSNAPPANDSCNTPPLSTPSENSDKNHQTQNSPSAFNASAEYAFGNSPPRTPLRKVCAGKQRFAAIRQRSADDVTMRDQLADELFELLRNTERCWPDAELARRAPNWGRQMSSICVRVAGQPYGTR